MANRELKESKRKKSFISVSHLFRIPLNFDVGFQKKFLEKRQRGLLIYKGRYFPEENEIYQPKPEETGHFVIYRNLYEISISKCFARMKADGAKFIGVSGIIILLKYYPNSIPLGYVIYSFDRRAIGNSEDCVPKSSCLLTSGDMRRKHELGIITLDGLLDEETCFIAWKPA